MLFFKRGPGAHFHERLFDRTNTVLSVLFESVAKSSASKQSTWGLPTVSAFRMFKWLHLSKKSNKIKVIRHAHFILDMHKHTQAKRTLAEMRYGDLIMLMPAHARIR